jgi:uncharacterized membrane protein YqjE
MASLTPEAPERSLTGLVGDVARDLTALVSHEVRLARIELTEGLGRALRSSIMLVGGALVALMGVQALIAAAILGLATTMAAWLAALIVGAVVLLVGGVAVVAGKSRLQRSAILPSRAAEAVRSDANMIREKFR